MPFDIGGAVNSATEWIVGNKLIGKTVRNPLFAALTISVIAVIIATTAQQRNMKNWKKLVRSGIYIFMPVLAILVVHQHVVQRQASRDAGIHAVRTVYDGITAAKIGGGRMTAPPIIPAAPPTESKPPTEVATPPGSPADNIVGDDFAEIVPSSAPRRR